MSKKKFTFYANFISIKLKLFILGFIIIAAFIIIIFSSTVINRKVQNEVFSTEYSLISNKSLIEKSREIDLLEISLSKITRYAKDAIIAKDESTIDEELFKKMRDEAEALTYGLENLKASIINVKHELSEKEEIKKVFEETEKRLLPDLLKLIIKDMKKAIDESHEKRTMFTDNLTRISGFLNAFNSEFHKELFALKNLVNNKIGLLSKKGASLEMFRYYKTLELINELDNQSLIYFMTSQELIYNTKIEFIDDKKVSNLSQSLENIIKILKDFELSEEDAEVKKITSSMLLIFYNLKTLTTENIFQAYEEAVRFQSDIDLSFLVIDNNITILSERLNKNFDFLSGVIKKQINHSSDKLAGNQSILKSLVSRSFKLNFILSSAASIIVIIFFTSFSASIVKPLFSAVEMAKAIEGGDFDIKLNLQRRDEIGELSKALDAMAHQLKNFTDNLSQRNIELRHEIEVRKKAESEIKNLNLDLEKRVNERTKELKAAQDELLINERLALIGHFSGSIAHELRNPLGVIDSSLYYINMKLSDSDQKLKDHLERIKKSVEKSTQIIQSLLNLAKMKKPDLLPEKADEALNFILTGYNFPDTILLNKDFTDEEIFVLMEKAQFEIALKNIIKNGIEAMNNSGELSIKLLKEKSGFAVISIKDSGTGIAPEDIDKIFQPLFSMKVHGIGFGLSITKMIVENHNGLIDVVSKENEGTEFIIKLPLYEKDGKENV